MYVRKNAATLTDLEWSRFMKAVIALKHTLPGGSSVSIYDQFVALHRAVTGLTGAQTGDGAHGQAGFLSWHREYIRRFEVALQQIDPEVTLPYWNWGLGPISETTALFQDDRIGTMGSGGASANELETGYLAHGPNLFNPMGWEVHSQLRPFGAALQRNPALDMGSPFPTAASINNIIASANFGVFRPALEWPPHGIIHVRVGRDMVTMTSPNDPIFFLHHCQVDRIWAKWQEDHPGTANFNPLNTGVVGHRVNDPMWPWDGGVSSTTWTSITGLLPTYPQTDIVRAVDVLDHHKLGYCYDDEPGCPCNFDDDPFEPVFTLRENVSKFPHENLPITTHPIGEEDIKTMAFGEEGPWTWVENGTFTTRENLEERFRVPRVRQPFGNF